jgi:hypothetical protein
MSDEPKMHLVVDNTVPIPTRQSFEDLEGKYLEWLYMDHDRLMLRIAVAAYLSVQYNGNPFWLMMIGSPGIGKSELLMSFGSAKQSVMMSKLTANALATAHPTSTPLLDKLKDNKILIIKDMSTISELPSEMRSEILSVLRDSYDGKFNRHTGLGEYKWEGKFGIIAGATPAMERLRTHDAALGERFLQLRIRMNPAHEDELQRRCFSNSGNMKALRKDLGEAASNYLNKMKVGFEAKMSREMHDHIHRLSFIVAKTRSDVPRDRYSREISSPAASSEIPTRLASQLFVLASALIEMGTDEDTLRRCMNRVCLDTLPFERFKTCQAIALGHTTSDEAAKFMRIGPKSGERYFEDLCFLNVAECDQMKDEHRLVMPGLEELMLSDYK